MTPRTKFADLDEERRESMLAAAAREFADHGYEGASVNRIIERAGISKGTLYYYFDDKEDLFATAVRDAFERFMRDVEMPDPSALEADTYWEAFRALARRSIEHVEQNEWYIRLALSFHRFRLDHGAPPALEEVREWSRRALTDILARGRALGVVRTDLPLPLLVEMTRALDYAADRWMLEHWNEFDEAERGRITDAMLDAFRDMLDARHEGWES